MTGLPDAPFKRDEVVDKPGIVGARWWHEGLTHADPVGRRIALQVLMVGGGVFAFAALVAKASSCSTGSSSTTSSRNALEMQKQFGWNFGGTSTALTFDGAKTVPYQPDTLLALPTDLAPAQTALRPYYVPTLLQSPYATPTGATSAAVDTSPILATALRPYLTDSMGIAYQAGKALASLFVGRTTDAAVIVDLFGHDAVAFAAGAADTFDPVFAVDNWPHSVGVVPAHLTLSAAIYFQPLFAKTAKSRPKPSPPMFILDRRRLTPLVVAASQFDNRHLARLPSPDQWTALGVRHLLYVTPLDTDIPELDDLNYDFVADAAAGVTVKVVGVNAFGPEGGMLASPAATVTGPPFYYGGTADTHSSFWVDYPWVTPPGKGNHPANVSLLGRDYVPVARTTSFTGPLGAPTRRTPPGFGTTQVLVDVATGTILGALLNQSSWNRSSGGWGG